MSAKPQSTRARSFTADFSGVDSDYAERMSQIQSFLRVIFPGDRDGKRVKIATSTPGKESSFDPRLVDLDDDEVWDDLLTRSARDNVFICSALFKPDAKDTKGPSVLSSMTVWVDIDPPHLDEKDERGVKLIDKSKLPEHKEKIKAFKTEWESLGALIVRSGSPGGYHVRFRVSRDLTPAETRALNWLAAERYEGDSKHSPESLLRLPGTRNHKSTHARDVKALRRFSRTVWEPKKLARALGWEESFEDLAEEMETQTYSGQDNDPGEEVNLRYQKYRVVRQNLEAVNESFKKGEYPNRFKATTGIVKDCMAARMSLEQAIYVANQSTPLVDKQETERGYSIARDVHRVWNKEASVKKGKAKLTLVEDADEAEATQGMSPDEFWNSRPILKHIRNYSYSRLVSPYAMLGITMARMMNRVHPSVTLPALVGGKAGLNSFIGIVGGSGDGKGTAESAAEEGVDLGPVEVVNIGSGEGIAHAFMKRRKATKWDVEEGRASEKGQELLEMHTESVMFSVPEIDTLTAIKGRNSSTISSELRKAWSGERLGFMYVDTSKRLPMEKHSYRMTFVCGVQPERAQFLQEDAGGGLPQRFIWAPAIDPDIPDFEDLPQNVEPMKIMPPAADLHEETVDVHHTIGTEIRRHQYEKQRGKSVNPLDSHRLLAKLKVAAALAFLDGKVGVEESDWELAEFVMRVSDDTRDDVTRELERVSVSEAQARGKMKGVEAVAASKEADSQSDARTWILEQLETKPVTNSHLKSKCSGRLRDYIQPALKEMEDEGLVTSTRGKRKDSIKWSLTEEN